MANNMDKLRKAAVEVTVEGLSVSWETEGQEVIGVFQGNEVKTTAHGQQEQSLFTDLETGEVYSVFHTLAIGQGMAERDTQVGDTVLIKYIASEGQFKRFAIAVMSPDGEVREPAE